MATLSGGYQQARAQGSWAGTGRDRWPCGGGGVLGSGELRREHKPLVGAWCQLALQGKEERVLAEALLGGEGGLLHCRRELRRSPWPPRVIRARHRCASAWGLFAG